MLTQRGEENKVKAPKRSRARLSVRVCRVETAMFHTETAMFPSNYQVTFVQSFETSQDIKSKSGAFAETRLKKVYLLTCASSWIVALVFFTVVQYEEKAYNGPL